MKKYLIIIITLSCVHYIYFNYINPPNERNYITNKTMFDFSNQQYKKRKLTLSTIGTESATGLKKYNKFILHFYTKNELIIHSGRKLLIEVANEFVESINKNKKLEEYLFPFPFTLYNIGLSMSVSDPIQGQKYYPEGFTENKKITYLILSEGLIYYYIHTHENLPMRKVFVEKIEDALTILKENYEI